MNANTTPSSTPDDLRNLAGDAEDVLRHLSTDADEQISDLRERLRATFSDVRDRFSKFQDEASSATRRAAANVDGYVRERPYTAIAAVLLVGVIAGALLTRRRPSSG